MRTHAVYKDKDVEEDDRVGEDGNSADGHVAELHHSGPRQWLCTRTLQQHTHAYTQQQTPMPRTMPAPVCITRVWLRKNS